MRVKVRDLRVGKKAHNQRVKLLTILQVGVKHVSGGIERSQRDWTTADRLRKLIDHIERPLRSLAHEDGVA